MIYTPCWPGIYDWPAGSNYPHTWFPCPMLGITFWIYKSKFWEKYQFNSTFFTLLVQVKKEFFTVQIVLLYLVDLFYIFWQRTPLKLISWKYLWLIVSLKPLFDLSHQINTYSYKSWETIFISFCTKRHT